MNIFIELISFFLSLFIFIFIIFLVIKFTYIEIKPGDKIILKNNNKELPVYQVFNYLDSISIICIYKENGKLFYHRIDDLSLIKKII